MSEIEIVLTLKTVRLLDLSDAARVTSLDDLVRVLRRGERCLAICMVCGATGETARHERDGYCDACGCNKVVSGLVLVDFFRRLP
jgi:hypothetical protein